MGKEIMRTAADTLKKVSLELGGKVRKPILIAARLSPDVVGGSGGGAAPLPPSPIF